MSSALTEEVAILALRNFFSEKPFVFFGTGMSCALDDRFGMPALKDAIADHFANRTLTGIQAAEWNAARQLLDDGKDLESALNAVADQALLRTIIDFTGSFISTIDREYAYRIARGDSEWPAIQLIKRLVDTLPSTDRVLHVLTPNYDMLFEYSCDFRRVPYSNGFFGGVECTPDWQAVDRAFLLPEMKSYLKRMKTIYNHKKHIRLYKAHGSLSYFYHRNAVTQNYAWMWNPPDFAERVMVTPGVSKYEMLQRYRQELLTCADQAINRAAHFLFLGYGFNDAHLEEYIRRKLITQSCHGLILTRDTNTRIDSMLALADNLWLVCRDEASGVDASRIYNRRYSGWLSLPGYKIWDIQEFCNKILGG